MNDESRPQAAPETLTRPTLSLDAANDTERPDTPPSKHAAEVAARVQDAYAVLVVGKASRRHVFFGLPAAERAVERARARGDRADMVLVRLCPVGSE